MKQRNISEEFILTLTMEGENDSLEVFLSGRALRTFRGKYSSTIEVVLWIKQPRVCASI